MVTNRDGSFIVVKGKEFVSIYNLIIKYWNLMQIVDIITGMVMNKLKVGHQFGVRLCR